MHLAYPSNKKTTLLFFVTVDWFFCSHFLQRAIAAKNAGYDVVVLTAVDKHLQTMLDAGLRVVPMSIDRRSVNPFAALSTLRAIIAVYRAERPDIVHHIALKPILLGTLAARIVGIKKVMNAVVGGGYLLASSHWVVRIVLPLFHGVLRLLLNPPGSKVVFENGDDIASFVASRFVRLDDCVLIQGAGVDPLAYRLSSQEQSPPTVVLAARLLWDKGVGVFVEAARKLKASGVNARFVIVGSSDPGNRASIDEATMEAWRHEGAVELWGYRTDMPQILEAASIACLPSHYREGLPKFLLEGMAAGLPCVTTDAPGCREAIRHGDNGLLIPLRDVDALVSALRSLIESKSLRKRMGARGRERLEQEFSSEIVVQKTLSLYETMLQDTQG